MNEETPKTIHTVQVPNGRSLVEAVAHEIRAARTKNAFAKIAVVAPTHYSVFYLRRAVTDYICNAGDEGVFNVEFMRIEEAADNLFDATPDRPQKLSMTRLIASELIHNAMSKLATSGPLTQGPLTQHVSNDSALDAVQRTLQELERLDIGATGALRQLPQMPLYRQLTEVYRSYSSAADGYVTRENKADIAAKTVIDRPELVRSTLAPTVLLIQYPRLPDAYSKLRDNLGRMGDTVTLRISTEVAERDTDSPQSTQETRFYSSTGAMDEPRGLIRNIVGDARAGISFGDMAILYPSNDYASRIKDALDTAGIANCGPSTRTLGDTAAGRFIALFLKMIDADLRRDTFTAWTTSSPVIDPDTGIRVPAVHWEVASRNARVSSFSEGARWQDSLKRYAKSMQYRADRAERNPDDDNPVDPDSLRSVADAAIDLTQFVSNLHDHTSVEDAKSWTKWVDWLTEVINNYLVPSNRDQVEEIPGMNRIRDDLEQVRALGEISDSVIEFNRFTRTILRLLRTRLQGQHGWGTSVLVAPLEAGIGNVFRAVHIVGMTEGVFPHHGRSDPLLPDDLRRRLDEDGSRLPTKSDQLDIGQQTFQMVLQSADCKRLYWNRALIGATNESYPSPWFVKELLKVNDQRLDLVKKLMDPENEMVASVHSLSDLKTSGDGAASEYEYDLLDVSSRVSGRVSERVSGYVSETYPLLELLEEPRNKVLATGRSIVTSRTSPLFGEHDGNVNVAARFTPATEMRPQSANSLQKYATCPYSYFLNYELNVDERIDPEDALTLSAMEKGTLVHSILEKFIDKHGQRGLTGSESELQTLRDVARSEFDRYQREEYIGYDAIFDLERVQLLRQLEDWHLTVLGVLTNYNESMSVEVPFGTGDDNLGSVGLPDGSSVRMRGKIDLIAAGTSGVFVVDFKTGRSYSYSDVESDVTGAGTKLQLPIYSAVAKAMNGNADSVRAAYWFVFESGSTRLRPRNPVEHEAGIERFEEVMGVIINGIRGGAFPANPGVRQSRGGVGNALTPWKNCRYCVYSDICPTNRLNAWEKKKASDELSGYRKLVEGTSV